MPCWMGHLWLPDSGSWWPQGSLEPAEWSRALVPQHQHLCPKATPQDTVSMLKHFCGCETPGDKFLTLS